jgi:hypothetical protein
LPDRSDKCAPKGETILEEMTMKASIAQGLKLLVAASILALAVSAAMAETDGKAKPEPKTQGAAKSVAKPDAKQPDAKKPSKPAGSGYATEDEARAHCKGEIVWVDSDHFQHYAGSREYGRKPGAFACEKG